VQRAIAPLAETIAQQTATIARLATALHALPAALPPPMAREIPPDTLAPHPHAFAAYQDAQQDIADQENVREDSVDQEGAQDRRVADRRTHDAGGIAQDRRVAARRTQQDRDRFEDAVLAQYVPPPPQPPPHTRLCWLFSSSVQQYCTCRCTDELNSQHRSCSHPHNFTLSLTPRLSLSLLHPRHHDRRDRARVP